MDAGALDQRITILSRSMTTDAFAHPVEEWTIVATVAAERLELRTADIARGPGTNAIAVGKFRIRYRTGISTAHRVRIDDTDFAITAIDPEGRRAYLRLLVEAVG